MALLLTRCSENVRDFFASLYLALILSFSNPRFYVLWFIIFENGIRTRTNSDCSWNMLFIWRTRSFFTVVVSNNNIICLLATISVFYPGCWFHFQGCTPIRHEKILTITKKKLEIITMKEDKNAQARTHIHLLCVCICVYVLIYLWNK